MQWLSEVWHNVSLTDNLGVIVVSIVMIFSIFHLALRMQNIGILDIVLNACT